MEPQTCGDVKIQVSVMNHVQSPEHRNCMKQDVLQINCQIEDGNCQQEFQPRRPVDQLQQSPTSRVNSNGGTDRRDWNNEPRQYRVLSYQTQIA